MMISSALGAFGSHCGGGVLRRGRREQTIISWNQLLPSTACRRRAVVAVGPPKTWFCTFASSNAPSPLLSSWVQQEQHKQRRAFHHLLPKQQVYRDAHNNHGSTTTSTTTSTCRRMASTTTTDTTTTTTTSMSPSWETKTITARGVEFQVAIRNPKARHFLLCLPGALGTGTSDFAQLLETGLMEVTRTTTTATDNGQDDTEFGIVALDPRGLGGSASTTRDYPLDFYRRDALGAAAVMDSFLRQQQVEDDDLENHTNHTKMMYTVLGWSDGANVAIHLAGAVAPDRVQNLVIWGGNAFVTRDDVKAWEAIRHVESSWSERMRNDKLQSLGLLDKSNPQQQLQQLNDDAIDGWCRSYYEKAGDVCLQELHQIICPTLILHGAKDVICHVSHAQYMARQIQTSQLVILPEGKHNLHQGRHAETFHGLVRDFLVQNIKNKNNAAVNEQDVAEEEEPKIDEIAYAFMGSKALFVALRAGVFDAIHTATNNQQPTKLNNKNNNNNNDRCNLGGN